MAISGVGVRELPEAHTFDFIRKGKAWERETKGDMGGGMEIAMLHQRPLTALQSCRYICCMLVVGFHVAWACFDRVRIKGRAGQRFNATT